MAITQKHHKFLVRVQRASARPGFQRITKSAATLAEAQALEAEITAALETYGRWPAPGGTLKEAARLALETHWAGMAYARPVQATIWNMVRFFEDRGKADIDDIRSEDVDAWVRHMKAKELSASYMNQQLGILRVVNQVAIKRDPPLASKTVITPYLRAPKKETWWLRPEQHQAAVTWLRRADGDHLFADYIDLVCYQGLRVEETLRLRERSFSGLDTPKPWLHPAGTKTTDAKNSVPVYPEALPVIQRCIARAADNGWPVLFPFSMDNFRRRWNGVREHLGVSDVPTATLKSLRRTFAAYANQRGMPTSTLQKVLRHKDIKTTAGYLNLIGSGEVDESRKYFGAAPEPAPARSNVTEIIKAYASTGATPEDVARFAKELMV